MLPIIKRIVAEDFPDQNSWIGKLITPLNQALDSVNKLLNKQLTFQDNFLAQVKQLEFAMSATATPLYFKCTLPVRPSGLFVVNAVESTGDSSKITGTVGVVWEYTQDGRVKINAIYGLTNGRTYTLTFVVI